MRTALPIDWCPGMSVEASVDARGPAAPMNAPAPARRAPGVHRRPTLPSPPTSIPWLGLLAVLMGTFISTLNGRLSTFGLADIRGAVGAGFDEGAWITTAQTAAQMFVTLIAVWMGAAYGPRRVLIWASISFAVISLITPVLARAAHAAHHAVSRRPRQRILHSADLELHSAQHAAASTGRSASRSMRSISSSRSTSPPRSRDGTSSITPGDGSSGRTCRSRSIMSLCLRRGIANKPITVRPPADLFGLVAGGAGLALIYAALDQGNRLDWLNSGLVWGLLARGRLAARRLSWCTKRARRRPLLNLKVVFGAPMPSLFVSDRVPASDDSVDAVI